MTALKVAPIHMGAAVTTGVLEVIPLVPAARATVVQINRTNKDIGETLTNLVEDESMFLTTVVEVLSRELLVKNDVD